MKDGQKQQEGHPEDVYIKPVYHFVGDFIGHSNFFEGVIEALNGERVTVKLDDGAELRVDHKGDWREGERIEVVVRTQKFELQPKGNQKPEAGLNQLLPK